MKTIMIRDDVYRKLNKIKGNKSFSDIIEKLIEESLSLRKKKLEKYFGILSEEEAKELEREIKEMRKMMKVLIESSAIIDYLKGNKKVKEVILNSEDFYVSSLTVYEILLGKIKESEILDFLSAFKIINPTKKDAIIGSQIYKKLKDKGKLIGSFDILISAQAINRRLTLVTKDSDFLKVKEEFDKLNLYLI